MAASAEGFPDGGAAYIVMANTVMASTEGFPDGGAARARRMPARAPIRMPAHAPSRTSAHTFPRATHRLCHNYIGHNYIVMAYIVMASHVPDSHAPTLRCGRPRAISERLFFFSGGIWRCGVPRLADYFAP